jgi:hypothetical protein
MIVAWLFMFACAGPSEAPTDPALDPQPAAWTRSDASDVRSAFPLPRGAAWAPADAYGTSLLDLPLRPPGTPVRTHDGRVVPISPVRVVDLPMVKGDLQQCADTAIRLRAEWLKGQGRPVMFHATSGDPIPWARVAAGEIPYAEGRGLKWRAGAGSWETYLRLVFTWAGTASLVAHDTVAASEPRAGDLLIQGGFPGHAIVILGVAVRGEETLLLLAQGFMPAQDLHVLVGPADGWWPWQETMVLPSWTMHQRDLRRWK